MCIDIMLNRDKTDTDSYGLKSHHRLANFRLFANEMNIILYTVLNIHSPGSYIVYIHGNIISCVCVCVCRNWQTKKKTSGKSIMCAEYINTIYIFHHIFFSSLHFRLENLSVRSSIGNVSVLTQFSETMKMWYFH